MGDYRDTSIHDSTRLKELQALPLERKVQISQTRILEWYNHFKGRIYVSFSGGKDSTVLLDIVRRTLPDKNIPVVFVNTGLEYPEIQKFTQSFDGVIVLNPKWGNAGKRNGHSNIDNLSFKDVVSIYGYPIISKEVSGAIKDARVSMSHGNYSVSMRRLNDGEIDSVFNIQKYRPLYDLPFNISSECCKVMKKRPVKHYAHKQQVFPITGQMAEEGWLRRQQWLKNGCNGFYMKEPVSNPLSFWTEQDIFEYIVKYGLQICSVYGEIIKDEKSGKFLCTGCTRTGCIFCAYGLHLEKGETRFQRLAWTHPKQYDYCINGGQWVDNPQYDSLNTNKDIWNPKQIWMPSESGLGMGRVFDMCNSIYGKDFMIYE
jgi:3'-phosphoadenosine 5'-phosphosulfate sulfotransferase (PAPS reductase)/FAD synthetase